MGKLQEHQCKKVGHTAIPSAADIANKETADAINAAYAKAEVAEKESQLVQQTWLAWHQAIDEDAQREVDAIVTDDGA